MGGYYDTLYPKSFGTEVRIKQWDASFSKVIFRSRADVFRTPPASSVRSWRTNDRSAQTTSQILASSAGRARETSYDRGHEFRSTQRRVVQEGPTCEMFSISLGANLAYSQTGQLMPNVPSTWRNALWPNVGKVSAGFYGPRAVQRFSPTKPAASLSTFLGELGRLPTIPVLAAMRSRAMYFRSLGSEYLNIKFGWEPFVRDITSIIESALRAKEISDKFQEESGKNLHRGGALIEEDWVTTLQAPTTLAVPFLKNGMPTNVVVSGSGTGYMERHTRRRVWFRGSFTYYLSAVATSDGVNKRAAQQTQHLLGLGLDPETLWNLAPWSWLADWVSNIGSNIANVARTSQYQQVMRYGYLMQETTIHDRIVTEGTVYRRRAGNSISQPLVATACESSITVDKQRVRATPYGFDLNPDTFVPDQWVTLGFLGMTKAPKSLRID